MRRSWVKLRAAGPIRFVYGGLYMMKNRLFALLSLSVFAFALAACGDDDDEPTIDAGPAGIDASEEDDIDGGGNAVLDPNEPLNELDADELELFCEETIETLTPHAASLGEVNCYFGVLLGGECSEKIIAACIADSSGDPAECDASDAECTGTVAEALACQGDLGPKADEIAAEINCENAATLLQEFLTVESCTTFFETCPSEGGKPVARAFRK
jgi:hypothetical protein